jgi:hypothetical protein
MEPLEPQVGKFRSIHGIVFSVVEFLFDPLAHQQHFEVSFSLRYCTSVKPLVHPLHISCIYIFLDKDSFAEYSSLRFRAGVEAEKSSPKLLGFAPILLA